MGLFRRRSVVPPEETAVVAVSSPLPPAQPSVVAYRSDKAGLRVSTPYGAAQFRNGVFTTEDPDVISTLDGLASREPYLLAKE